VARNSETGGIVMGALSCAAGLAGLVAPSLTGADMMRYGFALGTFGLVLLIAGGVVLAFYIARFRLVRRMTAGAGLLARWQCEPEAWRAFLRSEHRRQQAGKRGLFWLMVVLMVLIGAPFVLIDPEAGVWVLIALAGTALCAAAAAFVIPRWSLQLALERPGEVLIARQGVSVGGQLTTWRSFTSRLDHVTLSDERPAWLEFEVGYLSRVGRQTTIVRAPVPPGQEAAAQAVIVALSANSGE
jgi:hypothetical protein